MTAFARDLRSFLIVCVLTVTVVAAFPYSALTFKGRPAAGVAEASAAYVVLSSEEEEAALTAAKTSWQSDAVAARRSRVMLSLGELPEDAEGSFFEVNDVSIRNWDVPQPIDYARTVYMPTSVRQVATPRHSVDEHRIVPTFSREDLLNLK